MENRRWDRSGACGGVVFVVLGALAGFLGGEPPAADAPAGEITAYLADHEAALSAGLWLLGLGSVGLVWWFGALWRRMARDFGAAQLAVVSLLGLALAGPLALTSTALWAATASGVREHGDSAPVLYRLGAMLLGAEGFGLATHLLAANLWAVLARTLPIWLAVLGFAPALGFLVAAVLGAAEVDVNSSLGLAAFGLWCFWILGVSWYFWRGSSPGAKVTSLAH